MLGLGRYYRQEGGRRLADVGVMRPLDKTRTGIDSGESGFIFVCFL